MDRAIEVATLPAGEALDNRSIHYCVKKTFVGVLNKSTVLLNSSNCESGFLFILARVWASEGLSTFGGKMLVVSCISVNFSIPLCGYFDSYDSIDVGNLLQ